MKERSPGVAFGVILAEVQRGGALPRLCRRVVLAGSTLLLVLAGSTRAQQPTSETPSSPPTFRVDTGVVLLDVVVRDKKGRLVRDLRPEEVEVFEDGVRQQVTAFRFVETGREAVAPAAGAPTAAPRPEPKQVTLVTLLFDQLGNEARTIARKAALDFLAADHRALLWISVFAVDRRMRLLQQFTMDRDEVRAAVEVATGAAHSGRTDLAAESSRVGREAPPRPPGSTPPPRGMPPSPGSSRMRST